MTRKNLTSFAATGLLAALAGCYSFSGGTLAFKSIGVPVAGNLTAEYRAADAVTRSMIAALTRDGRMRVVEPAAAESRLQIDITGYSRQPFQYDRREVVSQYKVTITARAVHQGAGDKVAWRADSISVWSAYAADSETEAAGIEKAASNLAAEIMRQAFETW